MVVRDLGVLVLVVTGIVMTTVMQSSTAAITVTLSALYAGAVGLDQALALVIGQNIGTSTSSAMAAVGASSTAKRLAVAYIAFKLIAAVVALVLFPVVVRLMLRASDSVDPVTLVAVYHTAYNVVGVAILLPLIGPFTRVIERIVPERGSPLTRSLDPAALAAAPTVAVEAVRRTVARVLEALCSSAGLAGDDAMVRERVRCLAAGARLPLEGDRAVGVGRGTAQWLISTVHALDHTIRLAEAIEENAKIDVTLDGPDERRAVHYARRPCEALPRSPVRWRRSSVRQPQYPRQRHEACRHGRPRSSNASKRCSNELADLRLEHRRATLESVASGTLTANDAIARVEAIRLLDRRAHHAWRAAAHLAGAVT